MIISDQSMCQKMVFPKNLVTFLLLVCSCTHTLQSEAFRVFPGSQKNLGYQIFS